MNFDYIFIGTSLPMLFFVNNFIMNKKVNKNNILIIEGKNKIGGAWYTIDNKYCNNVDHGIHFIGAEAGISYVINEFKRYNIDLFKITNFDIEYQNQKNYIETGMLGCKEGWNNLIMKLFNNIKDRVKFNTEVTNITIDDECNLECKEMIFKCDKVFIPTHVNLKNITIHNNLINLEKNMNIITVYHILFFIKSPIIKTDENFHGIYNREKLFDRASVITSKKNIVSDKINNIAILRISKKFKDTFMKITDIKEEGKKFLLEKKIICENSVIVDYEITSYKFNHRIADYENVKSQIKNFSKRDSIEMVYTDDLGKLIKLLK
jgi:hypothetical protein